MDRKKLIKLLTYLIFFILVINFFANKFYWYSSIWYFDMIMHFLGGFWIGLAFMWFSNQSFRLSPLSPESSPESKALTFKLVFKILIFVLFIGISWEVYEILVNDILAKNSFNFLDTLSDIFFDLSGGLCAMLYLWKKLPK